MPYDYEFRLSIRAPRALVFERLLRIEHLARWFCGWARIEPKVGGTFQFGGETCVFAPEGAGWKTTIEEGEPLRRLAFTWPVQDAGTRVAYALEDGAEGETILTAGHTGVPTADSTCGSVQDAWRVCLGNLKSIAEGRGDSVRPDHAPAVPPVLRLTTLVEAPPAKVFAALTDAPQVDAWSSGGLPRAKADVDARPGGAYAFDADEGPDRVLEVETDRRLVLGWPRAAGDLRVGLSLEEKSSGTAIYLVAEGYGAGEAAGMLRHRGRWSDWFVGLKNLVEGGDVGFLNPRAEQVREA